MGYLIEVLFAFPRIYSPITIFLRGRRFSIQESVDTYISPEKGQKIADIGCGTGDLLEFLPEEVNYYGFDISSYYIRYAKKRYGKRGTFICRAASDRVIEGDNSFDRVVAMGVFHHLNDDEARLISSLAFRILKPGGKFILLYDGCYLPDITLTEKMFLGLDRGKYIRTEKGYRDLITENFQSITSCQRRDLLWLPYPSVAIECVK